MTQEEKARAYDEALEDMRVIYPNLKGDAKLAVEHAFPELAESEDERIRKWLLGEMKIHYDFESPNLNPMVEKALAWLEKQGVCDIDYPQKYQDSSQLNGCIVLEDFNGDEGFYKLNLAYLNKKQVEEVEEMVRTWNKESKASNENIKACVGMCLTDANEQRFKDYNTTLKDCLDWLEKQKECLADNRKTLASEDERILASIADCVGLMGEDGNVFSNHNVTKVQVLSWLEKPKKKGRNITANLLEDGITGVQRELIEFLANNVDASWVDIIKSADAYAQRIRSMLEKQKEQKPAEWGEEDNEEDIQTRFAFYTYKDDPCTLYLSNVFVEEASRNHGFGTRILRAAEKVAETVGATTISLKVKQNSPANAWYRKNGYGYVAFEDGYDWLEKNLEYMNPNKQEWDEFDEDCLKRAVWYIENPATSVVKDTNLALWLKSLPGRFNLQPKQEWSEEDEACIRNLESIIYYDKKLPNDTRVILGEFLSNLRPQPQGTYKQVIHTIFGMLKDKDFYEIQPSHRVSLLNDIRVKCKDAIECAPILDEPSWKPGEVCYGPKGDPDPAGVWKPSDEQMKALLNAEGFLRAGLQHDSAKTIAELYEQLKKLM